MPRTETDLRTAVLSLDRRWATRAGDLIENLRAGPAAVGLLRANEVVERVRGVTDGSATLPVIAPDAADGFIAVLEAHPVASLGSPGDVALRLSLNESGWSAALIVAGALALARNGRMDEGLFDALVSVALGASRADLLTRFVLTGGKGLDRAGGLRLSGDIFDELDDLRRRHSILDMLDAGCLEDLKAAAIGLAGAAATPQPINLNWPPVTGCTPNHGRPGTTVELSGSVLTATQTDDVQVVFTTNMGTTVRAEVSAWGTSQVTVIVPSGVGVGPVGFVSVPAGAGGNPTAGLAMASALEHCIGPGGGAIGDSLSHWAPPGTQTIPPALQPGGVNLFTGGPQLTAVSPAAVHVGDSVTITGHEFASGDRVQFDSISRPSTFVSHTSLTAVVPALRGGRRTVLVSTPALDLSNVLSVQVLPTLASLSRVSAKVGDAVEAYGTGFDSGAVVTLDGIPMTTSFIDAQTLRFIVRRPPVPSSRAVGGDEVQVQAQNPDGALTGALPLLVLEHIVVVFGDSIGWGQGLLTSQKFGDLLANALQLGAGASERFGAPRYLAHSGAIMGVAPPLGTLPSSVTLPLGVLGEVPAKMPTVHEQLTAAGAPSALGGVMTDDVRSVLLVAGMNSIDIFNVLNPSVSHATLSSLSAGFCYTEMTRVLARMVAQFPAAKIVVAGYYPIVSEQSDLNLLMAMLAGLGLVILPGSGLTPVVGGLLGPVGVAVASTAAMIWAKAAVISNCAFVATTIQADLTKAVKEVNLATPGKDRIAIAAIPWAPEHSIFAPDPWLFGIGFANGVFFPEDPMVAARIAVCGGGPAHCPIASLGHPNAKGAMAYADAMQAARATLA